LFKIQKQKSRHFFEKKYNSAKNQKSKANLITKPMSEKGNFLTKAFKAQVQCFQYFVHRNTAHIFSIGLTILETKIKEKKNHKKKMYHVLQILATNKF
jgi:hypothetical protein